MKKIIIITIFVFLFFGFWQTAQAQQGQTLIIDYPEVDGETLGLDTPLPDLIKYIYLFSLGIVGFVALLSILIGAIKYVASTGNASKAGEAKEQITQALLGILILLTAVLLLRIINPDLIKLKVEPEIVEVPVTSGEPITGCRYTHATFSPTPLNGKAGDPMPVGTLTFYRVGCTAEQIDQTKYNYYMRQVAPLFNLTCGPITKAGDVIEDSEDKHVIELHFNKYCHSAGIVDCNWPSEWGPWVCNMQENKPEKFFIEGEIIVPGQPKQHIYKININLIDNK